MSQTRSIYLYGFALLLCCSLAVVSIAQGGYGRPRTCPPNESYLSCGSPCQTTCATLGRPCLIQNIRCPDGCYCDKGYARDANGACIRREECPDY